MRSVPAANTESGMRRAPQRWAWEWRDVHATGNGSGTGTVGTFVGTLRQNGGKWRATLLSGHIQAPSVSD